MIMNVLKNYKFSIFIVFAIFYLCVRPTVPDVFYLSENNKIIYETESSAPFTLLSLRDFLGHVFAYVFLTFTLCMETTKYVKEKTLSRLQCICVCILLPILYGGIMEFVQEFFFPPRSAEWSDWIADVMGVVIGMCLFMFVNKKFKLNTNVTFF